MIPKIKKILYATDLSQNARHAFEYAASLANQYGAKITILHVFEELPHSAQMRVASIIGKEKWKEMLKDNEEEALNTMRDQLEEFCNEMSNELADCPFIVDKICVRQGIPVEEILDQCTEETYDMIVMGTHGHGLIGNALMGSVSRRVVRRSKIPVLVIRLPQ
jgi:nucleotide-binding universal stress UspA family protein